MTGVRHASQAPGGQPCPRRTGSRTIGRSSCRACGSTTADREISRTGERSGTVLMPPWVSLKPAPAVSDYWGSGSAGLSFLAGLRRRGRCGPSGPELCPGGAAGLRRSAAPVGQKRWPREGACRGGPRTEKTIALVAAALGKTPHVAITADLGHAERYGGGIEVLARARCRWPWTRAVAFAPVYTTWGFPAVLWDETGTTCTRAAAPYPHAREILATRACRRCGDADLWGTCRTAEGTRLIVFGWASLAAHPPLGRSGQGRHPPVKPTLGTAPSSGGSRTARAAPAAQHRLAGAQGPAGERAGAGPGTEAGPSRPR